MTSAVEGQAKMYNAHARVSPPAAAQTSTTSSSRPLTSAPPIHNTPGPSATTQTFRSDENLLQMFAKMSFGIEKMVALMEAKKSEALCGDGSPPSCWDLSESNCSFGSSERSSLTS